MALECKPTSHFLAAFNFSLSTRSVSFSPAHPPSPLTFPSPLSAPQWPSPTQSLEQCVWETACVTKAIKRTHAHIGAGPCTNTRVLHAGKSRIEIQMQSSSERYKTNVQMPAYNTFTDFHLNTFSIYLGLKMCLSSVCPSVLAENASLSYLELR